jgi:hypothetical protein
VLGVSKYKNKMFKSLYLYFLIMYFLMIQVQSLPIPVLTLNGEIYTNSSGFNQLMQLYNDASKFTNTEITLDCYELDWIDANLTAFLLAIEHRLLKEKNVSFRGDYEYFSTKFGVLFRNGWLKSDYHSINDDIQKTTVPCTKFSPSQELDFCQYINENLLSHRGMDTITPEKRKKIESDLLEIRNNILEHANTIEPFFVSGQYFPKLGYLIFTLVDLGVGFLKPIKDFTNGKIVTTKEAIEWALGGNSVTGNSLAGLGLEGICEYMNKHEGKLQVYSDNILWSTDLVTTELGPDRELRHHFEGSVLNLWFKNGK